MKQNMFVTAVFLLIHTLCPAQNAVLPLWPDGVPNYRASGETERRDTTDIVRISCVQEPDLSAYLPSRKNAAGRAVVIFPGGGYGILAYDWEGTDIAKWLNSEGIAGIVVKYRLPDSKSNTVPHQTPLMDAKRAVRLTRYHAKEWNIQPDRIGIIGFSAGGHLASTLGTHFDHGDPGSADPVEKVSSRPDFMILMYPVITFSHSFMHEGSRNNLIGQDPDPALVEYYSNELQVKPDSPPAFLVHAGDDKGVPVENSLFFYQALKDKGIPAEMHIYPQGGHGFSLAIGKGYLSTWTDRCVDWMRSLDQ